MIQILSQTESWAGTVEWSGLLPSDPGKVLELLVGEGQSVGVDAPLLLIEAMKMEQTVRACAAARVGAVRVEPGSMVGPGDVLILLEEPETSG